VNSGDEDATEREIDEDLDQISETQSKKDVKLNDEVTEPKMSVSTYFKFVWAFINSTMVSLTKYLNNYSNDYRYVRKVLAKEKKLLKVSFVSLHL
jgi:hypothetical protein